MPLASWVFGCDAPLDEFAWRMRDALQRRGWGTGPAQAFDFAAWRGGARAYVRLAGHDWGVQVMAKVKVGLLGSRAAAQRALWEAAREAQVGVAGVRPSAAPTRGQT